MLQISNLEDGKSEWNLSETHIIPIIPMVETDVNEDPDKLPKNAITLTGTNTMEHTLVIGLERNLLENYNTKDLVFIQNSDFKRIVPATESKIAYTLSYIDPLKNEISWGTPLKDKSKDWTNKQVFEMKDVLTYSDPVQESSKNWPRINKTCEQIILEDIDNGGIYSEVSKLDGSLLTQSNDTISTVQNQDGKDFIVSYYPTVETIPIASNSMIINLPRGNDLKNESSIIIQSQEINKPENVLNDSFLKSEIDGSKWVKSNMNEVLMNEVEKFKVIGNKCDDISLKPKMAMSILKKSVDVQNSVIKNDNSSKTIYKLFETDSLNADVKSSSVNNAITKDIGKIDLSKGSSLPEKSLPLKKKAKMKKTVMNVQPGDQLKAYFMNKDSVPAKNNSGDNEPTCSFTTTSAEVRNEGDSDSDEPLINQINKKKKCKKRNNIGNNSLTGILRNSHKKLKSSDSDSLSDSVQRELAITIKNHQLDESKNFWDIPDRKQFKTVYEVLEYLRNKKFINDAVLDLLSAGLSEMKADILKEMNEKCDARTSIEYSTELKAFALTVQFKQPAAFTQLGKIYGNGWPSIPVIKEWKQRLNSQRKPQRRNEKKQKKGEIT